MINTVLCIAKCEGSRLVKFHGDEILAMAIMSGV